MNNNTINYNLVTFVLSVILFLTTTMWEAYKKINEFAL